MRTEWLVLRGYRVIRFTNEDAHRRLDGVIAAIAQACVVITQSGEDVAT